MVFTLIHAGDHEPGGLPEGTGSGGRAWETQPPESRF